MRNLYEDETITVTVDDVKHIELLTDIYENMRLITFFAV